MRRWGVRHGEDGDGYVLHDLGSERSTRRVFLNPLPLYAYLTEECWAANICYFILLATTALRASAARSGSEGDIIDIMYRYWLPKFE